MKFTQPQKIVFWPFLDLKNPVNELCEKISNFMQYISVVSENYKMLKNTLKKSLKSLTTDRRYKNLDEESNAKKMAHIQQVKSLLVEDGENGENTFNTQEFLKDFGERSLEELKEFCVDCKENTHECKKMLKHLENFYSEIK